MQALLERPAAVRDRSARRRFRALAGAALAAAVVLGGTAAVRGFDLLPDLPFSQQTVDRTGPALMLALEDLAEYHAAQGSFQVAVDIEKDTQWLPSVISGERTTYLAGGSVDGIVDFTGLDAGAVTLSEDGRSVVISLPKPRLGEVRIDPANSRVVARDRGLLDRVGGAFVDNPTSEQPLQLAAQEKMARAAAESDLLRRSEDNTRAMLTALAGSLGVEDVTVRFDAADGL